MRGLWLNMVGSALFFPTIGLAAGSVNTNWTLFGTRPLAMGNAYVAIADDYQALFYNPAGLARLKSWDGEFFNPALQISSATTGLIQEAQQVLGKTSTNKMIETIENNTGKNQFVSVSLTPHLIFPNFGFALGTSLENGFTWHRSISVDINTSLDIIAPIAFAFNFLDNKLSVGVTTKLRAQAAVIDRFNADDISAFSKVKKNDNEEGEAGPTLSDYIQTGVGVGADFGILFTPSEVLSPTIGISVTDVGGTALQELEQLKDYSSTSPMIPPSVNLGFSMKPLQIDRLYLTTAVDLHSINQGYAFNKKLHAGLELGYGSWAKIQTGLHQGYLSAGLVLDIGIFNIKFATYSVELSNYAGYREQRRYVAQIKLL